MSGAASVVTIGYQWTKPDEHFVPNSGPATAQVTWDRRPGTWN